MNFLHSINIKYIYTLFFILIKQLSYITVNICFFINFYIIYKFTIYNSFSLYI